MRGRRVIAILALAFMVERAFARDADWLVCLNATDNDQSIAACTRLLATTLSAPDRAYAFANRGAAFFRRGDFARAIGDYDDALKINPGYDVFSNGRERARAALSAGALSKPAALAAQAGADSDWLVCLNATDDDQNIAACTRLLATTLSAPDRAYAFANRGEAFFRRGDFARAIGEYDDALKINPGYDVFSNGRERARAALAAQAASPKPSAGATTGLAAPAVEAPKPETAAVALAAPAGGPDAAPAPGRRIALVIANGAYSSAPLANPTVDAGIVKASLEKTGFTVTVNKDLSVDAFEQAIDDFADAARGAEVALFYFAGHGFSIAAGGRQQNLLMATDADFHAKTSFGLQRGGEPLEHVEEVIIGHARATLIFVDACREVPALAIRGASSRGFAPFDVSAFEGAFVVISTRSGRTAADGVGGQGSPFARAFAAILPTPRLRIEDAYARIREKVRAETSGEQVPDVIRSDLPEGGVVLARDAPNEN
jgi:tetratricopeptide (TPR) repeat protein